MKLNSKLLWLTLFGMAMGFLETAVVIYMRKIYYPAGFQFPLVTMDTGIVRIEIIREAATILMLLAIGVLTGNSRLNRFAYFLYCFSVWDLFYYVFLKVLLDWPDSLFTLDILFLIPVPWVGPVLAPCIVSISMIAVVGCILWAERQQSFVSLKTTECVFLILGAFIIICSFIADYLIQTVRGNQQPEYALPHNKAVLSQALQHYMPQHFNWYLLGSGELFIGIAVFLFIKQIIQQRNTNNESRKQKDGEESR